jgi:iron complex outermembrane receptor protein
VTEIVSGIDETLQNLSAFETNGVDWDIRYLYDLGFGQLDLGMAGTWTRQFEFSSCVGCPLTVLDGQYGTDPYFGIFSAFPEWQFQATYGFSRDNWGVEYAMEYMSAVTEASEGQAFDQLANSRLYHDITGWVEFGKITLRAGVRNLADSDPPYTTNNNDMNTIPISYRTAGRYFYARASVAF